MTTPEEDFEEGYRLYREAECEEDLAKAFELLGKASAAGIAGAQDVLGNMYEDGDGAPEDPATAAHLYRLAADQGHPQAMYDLGLLLLDGRGVEADEQRAFSLVEKAYSMTKAPEYAFMLSVLCHQGRGTEADEDRAMDLLKEASDGGCPEAMANLGAMALSGEGVPKDVPLAFRLLKEAAEEGECSAMCNLGLMYEGGMGVDADDGTALSYYRQAADLGYPPAFYHLAVLAAEGRAGIGDMDTLGLLEASGEGGCVDAIRRLGECYYHGDGIEADPETASQYFRAGADMDDPACMYDLGVMIVRGEAPAGYDGEEYDLILAAADAGYGPAEELVSGMEERSCSYRPPRRRSAGGDGTLWT